MIKKTLTAATAALALSAGGALAQTVPSTGSTTSYHVIAIEGIDIFYREAGPRDAPTLLLLHGYPSSSRMFDTLIPLLADRYHIVAPDYPGFGRSDAPSPASFAYNFDHLAAIVD